MQGGNGRQPHNNFNFDLPNNIHLNISSDFDSGNLQSAQITTIGPSVQQIPIFKATITPAIQPFNPAYSNKPSTKTFFHYNVKCSDDIILHTVVRRMTILSYVQNSLQEIYRICVGKKPNPYTEPVFYKIKPYYMKLYRQGEQYVLQFKYQIKAHQRIYFAYHYPYSVQKLTHYLHSLNERIIQRNQSELLIKNNKYIYYRNQLLIQSVQKRPVNLLTITQINRDKIIKNQSGQQTNTIKQIQLNLPRQSRISRSLFPYFDLENRPYKFNKPYIMITCRVHPGETSASFALQGFINYLIESDSHQIDFLLRSFVFLIVPMVNPDGVYNGTYRMDTLGHNLNRFYNSCSSHKHPSIFAIQTLMNSCCDDIVMFFDIHSHPQLKGSFIYGNAFNSIYDQIESQIFAKLLSVNSECFSYQNCSFSQRNMTSKDINELMTKDGSARVYVFKRIPANIHCYTVEMGYHGAPVKKQVSLPPEFQDYKNSYRRQDKQFIDKDYEEHGAALLITIAQVYLQSLNCSQIINSSSYSNKNDHPFAHLRQEIGKQINDKEQRFKILDGGLNKKLKTTNLTIINNFYAKIFKKYPIFQESYMKYKQNIFVPIPIQPKKTIQLQSTKKNSGLEKPYRSQTLALNRKDKNIVSLSSKKQIVAKKYTQQIEALFGQEPPSQRISVARHLTRALKQKIHITPFQFQMPPEKKKKKTGSNLNKMMLNFDPLPKISKKTSKILSERHKALRQRRINPSFNKNSDIIIEQQDKNFNKMTIDSKLTDILDCQALINCENYREFHDSDMKMLKNNLPQSDYSNEQEDMEQDSNDENPFEHRMNDMNFLHMGMMYKKNQKQGIDEIAGSLSKKQQQILKNYNTEKLSSPHSYNTTKMRERSISVKKNPERRLSNGLSNQTFLPKLQIKTDRIRNKYEVQIKMQQKYEKQFKISHKNWKKQRRKSSDQFHM